MFFESALKPETLKRIQEIGKADVVVGIPTYRNSRTIAHVMQTAAEGLLQSFPDKTVVLMTADGMSTDDTYQVMLETPIPRPVHKVVSTHQGLPGKGNAIRSMWEAGLHLGTRLMLFFDGDLRNIQPDWVGRLGEPIWEGKADFVWPMYARPMGEVTINRNLAYPFLRTMYGLDVFHPLPGEFAISPALLRYLGEKDVWETDVARHGLNAWMATLLANESKWKTCQVPMGTKVHDYKDPISGFEPKFLQAVGTLFRLMSVYRRRWPQPQTLNSVPVFGDDHSLPEMEVIGDALEELHAAYQKGMKRYRRQWKNILHLSNLSAVEKVLAGDHLGSFPLDLWARVVYDFAVVYNKGEGDPDKVVLALLPLYYARVAAFVVENQGKSNDEVYQSMVDLALVFDRAKPYLVDRWMNYVPWEATGVR
ncbi:MAG: hypothetical protein EXR62_08715 [Chloroflexi bacterium]|nr:hypothetical protein [Chloroflexota bacterium]